MATVLIVDDHSTNRDLIKTVLGYDAHAVIEASDGVEGLARARDAHPDLVITDVLMPAMDGFEFCRQLRTDESLAHTPVIFYTATYLEHEARELAQACGVSHFLLKPAEPQEILSTVRAALEANEPAPAADLTEAFGREHLRVMTNKLARKVDDLEETNLRLTQEVAQRRRAELALQESQARIERLSSIRAVSSEINAAIVRIRNRRELLHEAARIAVKHGEFSRVAIGMIGEAGVLEPLARAESASARAPLPEPDRSADELAAAVLAKNGAVLCNDIETEERMASWKHGMLERGHRAALALPLVAARGLLGVVEFYAAQAGFFNEKEIELLQDLAGDLSFALQYIDNEEKLNYLAYYDNLTGLPNRTLFCDRVDQLLRVASRGRNRSGIVVVDVERFNTFNDTFGRHASDVLLKEVAERLKGKVASADWFASATRSSFAACLPAIRDDAEIAHFLESVMSEIAGAPFSVEGDEIRVTLKGGAAIYPADGENAEKLLRNAETALQRAKASADPYLFFTEQMSARMAEKLTLERRLQQAIQDEEFILYYQPIVDTRTRRVLRFEGLLRWKHPEKGLIAPAAFIPILEESGLIVDAGKWVLQRAAADYRSWMRRLARPPRVSVNVSPLQLREKGFAQSVAEAAAALPAEALDLEITEGILMQEMEQNSEKLQKLSELGVAIVIDDFGTGYSSLSYLARLPVSTLKIDRSFIRDLEKNRKGLSIVTAIISLAHSMNLTVVAEGVETAGQWQLLQALKCDEIQGYHFSPPMPPAEIEKLLERIAAGNLDDADQGHESR